MALVPLGPTEDGPSSRVKINGAMATLEGRTEALVPAAVADYAAVRRGYGATRGKLPVDSLLEQEVRTNLLGQIYAQPTYVGVTRGYKPSRTVEVFRAVTFYIANTQKIARFRLRVYSRPAAELLPDSFVRPGSGANDVLLFDRYYPTVDVADNAPGATAGVARPCRFPVDLPPLYPDHGYFPVLTAVDAANAAIEVEAEYARAAINATIDPYWQRGTILTAGGFIVPPNVIPVSFSEAAYDEDGRLPVEVTQRVTTKDELVTYQREKVDGDDTKWLVRVPIMTIRQGVSDLIIKNGHFVLDVPEVSSVSDEVVGMYFEQKQELAHQCIDDVVVRRVDDNALLVENVDYKVYRMQGVIERRTGGAPYDVKVSYSWAPQRYDEARAVPDTAYVQVYQGDERIRDPNEWMPAPAYGLLPLMRFHVTRFGVEIIPIFQWDGMRRYGAEAVTAERDRDFRSRIPATMKKLRLGLPVKIACYSDSTDALGAGSDFDSPNGVERDLKSFFAQRYASDTLAAIPAFDFLDGGGAIHTKASAMWVFIEELRRLFGHDEADLILENWSVAGTTSGTGSSGSAPNGLNPSRLDAYLASGCDLGFIGFGMNYIHDVNFGSSFHYDNTVSLIALSRAAGIEPVVRTPFRPNGDSGPVPTDWWLRCCRQIVLAARDQGAAYIDFSEFAGPGNEAGLGISAATMCDQNLVNHPGLFELAQYGRFMARRFQS